MIQEYIKTIQEGLLGNEILNMLSPFSLTPKELSLFSKLYTLFGHPMTETEYSAFQSALELLIKYDWDIDKALADTEGAGSLERHQSQMTDMQDNNPMDVEEVI